MNKLHLRIVIGLGALMGGATLVSACGDSGSGGGPSTGGASSGGSGSGGETSSGGGNNLGGDTSTGGGGGATDCPVTPPASWSAPDWETNTAAASALLGQLVDLAGATGVMRNAEAGTVTDLELSDLTAAFEDGSLSLKDVTTPYFVGVVENVFEEFVAAIAAGAQDLVDDGGEWEPGAAGGIWATAARAYNTGGLELRQVVDKGLFGGAAFYNRALALTEGTIDAATVDALAALFGANAGLNPGNSGDATVENRNLFSANYVFRMGLYSEARQALIDAKAFGADAACVAERDQAIQHFFRTWELGLFARLVYYSHQGATLNATAETQDEWEAAFHLQAEGVGLAMGFYGLSNPASGPLSGGARIISDEAIADAMALLGIDVEEPLGDATYGGFVSDADGYADAVKDLEDIIAGVYGLTPADIEIFRNPTEG